MTGSAFDLERLLWPGEQAAAVAAGRTLGAAALRLAQLPTDRSAVPAGRRVALVATGDRFLVVLVPSGRATEVAWQVQLPRLVLDLHRLPGQLVIRAGDRYVAVELDDHRAVGPFLAALAG